MTFFVDQEGRPLVLDAETKPACVVEEEDQFQVLLREAEREALKASTKKDPRKLIP